LSGADRERKVLPAKPISSATASLSAESNFTYRGREFERERERERENDLRFFCLEKFSCLSGENLMLCGIFDSLA
jgi:hypothetical protein